MTPGGMAIGIAHWDGEGWTSFGQGLSDTHYLSYVNAFAAWNGKLAIGGRLAHRQSTPLPSVDLRIWDGDRMETLERRVSALKTPNIDALVAYRGDLVAARTFTEVSGVPAPYLARWDGAAWHALATDLDAPASGTLTFRFTLPEDGRFRLTIHDVRGGLVASLAGSTEAAGAQILGWDGRDGRGRPVPSGVYWARLEFAGQVRGRTLVLIR